MDVYELIRRHEGLRLRPYADSMGHLTIGYGRALDIVGISREEAEAMLRADVERAREALKALEWFGGLDDARSAALIDMAFNLGGAGLGGFSRFLDAMKRRDFGAAAREMLDSKWAGQVGGRARELAAMIRTGRWPQR